MRLSVRIFSFGFLPVLLFAISAWAVYYPVGDLDEGRDVDFDDLRLFAERWLDQGCLIIGCEADLNGRNGVNAADFALLARNWGGTALITEFMASNHSELPLGPGEILDEDGKSSDWIELYNPSDTTVNLAGWCLTHDPCDLNEWQFPDVELDPGEFMIVFASGNDRRSLDPNKPLHTNFNLNKGGDCLALVARDGKTIVQEFTPEYPNQYDDISYGLAQYAKVLVLSGAEASYRVPVIGDAGADWTVVGFDDSAWKKGKMSLGFGFGGVERASYNDCVWQEPQYIGQNVTTYGIGSGLIGVTSGPLLDQATGEPTGVTAALEQSGGVNWQPSGSGGSDCAPGTDAFKTFGGLADMTGVIYYGSTGWWVDLTFTGLDPSTEYTFATSAARNSYSDRYTRYTIGGADTFTNASTAGTDIISEDAVRFNTGDNHNQGYIARWTGIRAADGTFKVCAEADPDNPCSEPQKAYAFDVFMLKGGFGGTDLRDQMQNINASIWARVEFRIDEDPAIFDTLTLRLKYEDAFVAYLNGIEVARDNFAGATAWNSTADENRKDEYGYDFVTFNISDHASELREGTNVLAIHGLNDNPSDPNFLMMPELIAASSMDVRQYFAVATPGEYNTSGALDIVADTKFSHDRGFYTAPFSVTITTETAGATIHYTTDGSAPSDIHGNEYIGPIEITTTTPLRAMAFKPGWVSSDVDTQTYIFLDGVINQPSNPAGFPESWGGTAADYEMNQGIVGANSATIRDDLKSIPTMSLVAQTDDIFGSGGIYSNPWNSGISWERPASIELIYPDESDGFQLNCGVRIYGGVGRQEKKKTFRLLFKRTYGPTKLQYPIFGEDAADQFDTIILRANFNDGYPWGGGSSQYIRDEWMRQTNQALGHPAAIGTFVHLYVNGLYWGLYNPSQRPDTAFSATYYGGDKADWDGINSTVPVNDSQTVAWNTLMSMSNEGLENNRNYQQMQGNNPDGTNNPAYEDYIDIDQYINFLIVNFYGGNNDWMSHNWYAGRIRGPQSTGWKAYTWDAEWVMGIGSDLNTNSVGHTTSSNYLLKPYTYLRLNTEFRLRFGDHAHKAFFNGGPLYVDPDHPNRDPSHPERNRPAALYAELADMIERAMICETARWGDVGGGSGYNIANWRSARDWVINSYMPNRSAIVLGQLRNAGLYPSIDAPTFNQQGGAVPNNFSLTMTAEQGTIYYTLDASDPRLPIGQSTPGGSVVLVAENAAKKVLIPTEPVESTTGSILYEYWTGIGGTSVSDLTSNANYPANPSGSDYISIFESPVNWADYYGVRISGYLHPPATAEYTFWISSDDNSQLWLSTDESPGNAILIAREDSWTESRVWEEGTEKSAPIYLEAGKKYYVEALMKEDGGGDNLAVTWDGPAGYPNPIDAAYLSPATATWYIPYYDDSTWPNWTAGTTGVGYERESGYEGHIGADVEAQMYNTNAACYIRIPFSTGHADYLDMKLRIKYDDGFVAYINGAEVTRRNFTGSPAWNSAATGENPDASAVVFEEIDISSHVGVLRAGENLLAIQGLNLAANDPDFLISVELIAGEIGQGDPSPDALEYTGAIALDRSAIVKARAFNGAWSALNEATFAVGPVADNLRITEIMYHPRQTGNPDDPNEEYIELKNIGGQAINLNLVKFTNGIDFTFGDIELATNGLVVIVRDQAAFDAQYPAFSGVLAGQYYGSLNDGGERIELEDAIAQTIYNFKYDDDWRPHTDGEGFSLTIIDPLNPDPNTWDEKDS
ncbi:MAG: chitobiase/beta-hexosaminidase C-terminal domain-containing protein, partial [Sedimentisphaerales bacterium]|nr:chitobiase/beta-hexosaminidase C-terminal domain-containing protein [Sedimentisphaerales bacterium]